MELTRPQKLLIGLGLAGIIISLVFMGYSQWRPRAAATPALVSPATTPIRRPAVVGVHVAGMVRIPGLYWLPAGSRVAAATAAAGGLTPGADETSVNLAAVLEDGQQVVVSALPAAAPAAGADLGVKPAAAPSVTSPDPRSTATVARASAPPTQPATPISLSTATLDQLTALPGIGPELARRIAYYRYEHGGFRTVDDLLSVEGIGPQTLQEIRPLVRP